MSIVLSGQIVLFECTINTLESSTNRDDIGVSGVIDYLLTDSEENLAQPINPCNPALIVHQQLASYGSWQTFVALSNHMISDLFLPQLKHSPLQQALSMSIGCLHSPNVVLVSSLWFCTGANSCLDATFVFLIGCLQFGIEKPFMEFPEPEVLWTNASLLSKSV